MNLEAHFLFYTIELISHLIYVLMWPYLQLENNDCSSLVLVLKCTPRPYNYFTMEPDKISNRLDISLLGAAHAHFPLFKALQLSETS